MRPSLRGDEYMSSANRTEPAIHDIAAVGDELECPELPVDGQRGRVEERIDRATSSADRLAHPAPARPCGNRRLGKSVSHGLTQTSAGQFHIIPRSETMPLRSRDPI